CRGSGCSAPGLTTALRRRQSSSGSPPLSAFQECGYPANRPARSAAGRKRPG
ncbi:hypothetical protein AZZ95_000521, partial [Enterobacter roggenkampii]